MFSVTTSVKQVGPDDPHLIFAVDALVALTVTSRDGAQNLCIRYVAVRRSPKSVIFLGLFWFVYDTSLFIFWKKNV